MASHFSNQAMPPATLASPLVANLAPPGAAPPSSEAALAPTTAAAGSWLNPGFEQSTLRLLSNGSVVYNEGPPHGLVARGPGGQLLLCFHYRGEAQHVVPHLLRPVEDMGPATRAWRTDDLKEVLALESPLEESAVPPLVTLGGGRALWFVPGTPPGHVELARGGSATFGDSVGWWGLAQPKAEAETALLVISVAAGRGEKEKPFLLRQVADKIWRCAAHRCVLVVHGADPPCLRSIDLPRFVPREGIKHGLLWLHPGRVPQSLSLTEDVQVAWAEIGGNSSGPRNGSWKRFKGGDGANYLEVNYHYKGDVTALRSTLLQLLGGPPYVHHAVGSVGPGGSLLFAAPGELKDQHVLAIVAELPVSRPGGGSRAEAALH